MYVCMDVYVYVYVYVYVCSNLARHLASHQSLPASYSTSSPLA